MMHKLLHSIVICLITVCITPLYAIDTQTDTAYELGSGDKLVISVFNQDELTGEYTVSGSGHISMPFIGSVMAMGLTVAGLQEVIISKLKPDYLKNPRVSIEVANYRPFYIIGEVKKPSSYPYVYGMTYLNAVAIAGGFTYRAKKSYAMVRNNENPDAKEVKVDMHIKVKPGDIIRIKERLF